MNRLILVVTAFAVSTLAIYAVATSDSGEDIDSVSVPQPASGPPPVLVALPKPVAKPMPSDFPSLAREIQRELRRVGCYRGEVNGLWTPATRTAMKAFIDDANAVLPVDKPDQVLLSLLQGERGTACDSSCPPGQQRSPDGACSAGQVAASNATATGSIDRKPDALMESAPPATAMPIAPPAPAPPARVPDDHATRSSTEPPGPVETAALDNPPPAATEGDLVPPPVAGPAKPRRMARYPRPPKFVRSIFRNIKRSLGSIRF